MKRQDELNEAWCKYMGKCSTEILQALAFALRWCDAHPHWISVEDELPPKKSEYDGLSNNVFATDGKEIYESVYNHDFEEWFTHDLWAINNITHWMPLPQPLTLREQAAIAAMQGVMNFFGSIDYNRDTIDQLAVEQADALIEELKKK